MKHREYNGCYPMIRSISVLKAEFLTHPIAFAICVQVQLFSQFLFAKSMKALGNQYSPCFDSKISTEIVAEGPYKNIRHPIYTANILTLASITLLSQSYIILVLEMIFIYFCLRSAKREEKILSLNLLPYKKYMASTGMFFPKMLF